MSNNFPGALNTGTSLVNTRVTGDTIPVTDHNDLANAEIAVETKVGYGSSTPSTAGQVLTSIGSGQSAWQNPASGSGGTLSSETDVALGTLNNGDVLVYNSSAGKWQNAQPAAASVPDATTGSKGAVQLAGDLAGTAALPRVLKLNGVTPATVATSGAYSDLTGKPTIPAQFNPIAGANITLTGSYPNVTIASAGSGGSGSTAFFNVKSYGAAGNGSADDTIAIQNAINAALGSPTQTGTVYFPAGIYKITSTLKCSSASSTVNGNGVILRGDGHQASIIFKNSSFNAVEFKGFQGPSEFPTAFGGMVDITVNGNGHTGACVSMTNAQQMFFRGCSFIGNNDVAWDVHTVQDSYFSQCTFNNCGSTTAPVINIYGDQYGTANMLYFSQIRVETFFNGAVWIKRGAGATGGGNNGFFWNQCKFENFPTVHGDIFVADNWTQQLIMSQIFISFGQYDSGYSTPANGIVFGDGSGSGPGANQASFRDVFMNAAPTANIGNSVIKLNGGGVMDGGIVVDNIYCTSNLNSAVVNANGMTGADVVFRNINGQNGKFSGDGSAHTNVVGTGTLVAGTVTITASRVQSTSRIFLTRTSGGANAGNLYVSALSGGTSFTVTSTNGADTGTFNWEIKN